MKRTRNAYHIQIRKNKKLAENVKRNAFLQACLDNKCNIFSLIRKERKPTNSIPAVIDGVSTKIEKKFAEPYQRLYNSVDDKGALTLLKKRLSVLITASSTDDVQEITPDMVQEAINLLKSNKTDPVVDFNSDYIKNAQKNLDQTHPGPGGRALPSPNWPKMGSRFWAPISLPHYLGFVFLFG